MTDANPAPRPRPVVLCILDGWGYRQERQDNAIALARTPNWTRLLESSPHALLSTSGMDVGLPDGQMGNSEVGHMNIGSGRVVMQDLPRIDQSVASGALQNNRELLNFIDKLRSSGGTAHVLGLLSPGGVHSHQDHIAALARCIAAAGIPVIVHAFLDGRDTPPRSALEFLGKFLDDVKGCANVTIGTVSGRYFAMDRDKRWDRVERAYQTLVDGAGVKAAAVRAAVRRAYDRSESDEFVQPTAIAEYPGMRDGDGLLMANFRADRAREILTALLDPAFDGFKPERRVKFAAAAGMVEYSAALNPFLTILFAPERLTGTLGELVAKAGLRQLRIAETEKYAHVTFFLNGGEETVYPGEDRILVPSPKVATYDLQPEMAAPEVTERLVGAIASGRYDLIVVNYANPDMVGHTGMLPAAVHAVETIDGCLGRLDAAVQEAGGVMLITADHGNIEMMTDPVTHEPYTAHTTNLVPVVLVNADEGLSLRDGKLADVAPTLLPFLGLAQPAEMTGRSLLKGGRASRSQTRASA